MTFESMMRIMDAERNTRHMSGKQLSLEAGVAENTFSNWRRGKCEAQVYTLERMLNALGLELCIRRKKEDSDA